MAKNEGKGTLIHKVRLTGIVVFYTAFLATIIILATKTPINFSSIIFFLISLVLGWLAADVLTGIIHLTADKKFNLDTPLMGAFVRPFREHHVDPQEMTRQPISKTLGTPALGGVPVQILVGILAYNNIGSIWVLWFFTFLFVWAATTNLFHRWAHSSHPPTWIRLLQRTGIILSPTRHKLHHQTHNKSFAITSGFTNLLFDKLFFSKFVDEQ